MKRGTIVVDSFEGSIVGALAVLIALSGHADNAQFMTVSEYRERLNPVLIKVPLPEVKEPRYVTTTTRGIIPDRYRERHRSRQR